MNRQIRLTVVTKSVSRMAGGLFTSVREITQMVASQPSCEAQVFGFADAHTAEDLPVWLPLQPVTFPCRGPSFFPVSPALLRAVLESKPDLIHAHGIWTFASLVDLIARRRDIPYIISAHGMLDPWAVANSRWKKRLADFCFEGRHLRGSVCLRALCASEAASMRAYGLRNPICVIPNGIDLPEAEDPPTLKLRKVLLFLGRIHPKKGIPHLLTAWQRERQRLRDWELVVAGWDQGGHEEELRRQVNEMGITESVRFAGPLFNEAKDKALRAATAFILPSFSEGLPMSVLEAWAYGKPVLMTPECNLPEGFAAEAALCIEAEPGSIVNGLRNLAEMNEHQLAAMGAKGRALVEERFAWPQLAAQMRAVYDWVLGGGSPPACVVEK